MSFANKCTVVYRVWSLDVWSGEEEWTVNDRREVGVVSVRTDRQNKSGQWDVSNRALVKALNEGHFLRAHSNDVLIDGEDDGILNVDEIPEIGARPLLQLEYERHHDVPEKSSGIFNEPGAKSAKETNMSRSNPLSSLSTGEKVGIAAAGVAALGFVGYLIWKSQQSASTAASLPVVQTPMPGTTQTGSVDQSYGVQTGGVVYDPNLGGPLGGGSGLQPGYQGEVTTPQTQAGIPGVDNISGTTP